MIYFICYLYYRANNRKSSKILEPNDPKAYIYNHKYGYKPNKTKKRPIKSSHPC